MILVRDVFQLKFGKAREAINLFRESPEGMQQFGSSPVRLLTDLSGTFYTLVMETTFDSMADYENSFRKVTSNSEWKQWYQKVIPLVETGRREIFTIVK